eukprot:SAG25_NODE_1957_length_2100_cov_1.393803_2_plen_124_part_00
MGGFRALHIQPAQAQVSGWAGWPHRRWASARAVRSAASSPADDSGFCRISDEETHLLRNITDDEDDGSSLMDRMKTDDSLYDDTTCLCIHYDNESSGLGWRANIMPKKSKLKKPVNRVRSVTY